MVSAICAPLLTTQVTRLFGRAERASEAVAVFSPTTPPEEPGNLVTLKSWYKELSVHTFTPIIDDIVGVPGWALLVYR